MTHTDKSTHNKEAARDQGFRHQWLFTQQSCFPRHPETTVTLLWQDKQTFTQT